MKKIAYLIQLLAVTLLFSSAAVAHDRDWGRHRHGWGRHHGHGHHGWGGHPRQPVNNYYQQPQAYYQPRPSTTRHNPSTTMAGVILTTGHTKAWRGVW